MVKKGNLKMIALENSNDLLQSINNSDKIIIAIFTADWCGDCHYLYNFIDEIEKEYSDATVTYQIDIEQFPNFTSKLQIVGIPSLVAFSNGNEISRLVNRMRKSKEEVRKFYQNTIKQLDQ